MQGDKNKLCYQYICGICPRGENCYMKLEANGHPPPDELDVTDPDTGRHFVDHLWDCCKKGVEYIRKHGDDFNLKDLQPAKASSNSKAHSGGKHKQN
jgi:hypothetical protein